MEAVRRVVIRDRYPVLGPEILSRPLNRLALAAAAASLIVQCTAIVEEVGGHGRNLPWPEYLAFSTVALLWLVMGLLVFLQRSSHRSGPLFLLSASAGAAFLSLGSLYGTGMGNALLFAAGAMLFSALLLSFARAYTGNRVWHGSELLLYAPVCFLLVPGAADLAAGRTTIWWKLCVSLVTVYLLAAIVQSWLDLQNSPAGSAAQSRALVFGLVAGTVPGVILFVVPLVVTSNLYVGTILLPGIILMFLIAMSYAVLLFELSNADLIVRRGIVYALITAVTLVVYAALGSILNLSRASLTGVGGGIGFVAVTIAVGAAFGPVRSQGRRFVDWLFYGRRADRWDTLQSLSSRLGTVMQPQDLSHALVTGIAHALHLRGAFILARFSALEFILAERTGGDVPESTVVVPAHAVDRALGHPPLPLLLVHSKPITASRQESTPSAVQVFDDLHIALAVPLVTRSGLEAVLCLSPKLSHDEFGRDDLELLGPIVRQATVALENALLFARLEEKVEELRSAYRRIASEQEAERTRLARELHDGTAQDLAGLITLATVAERQVGEDSPGRATLARIKQRAEETYQEVRRASHALRPPMLDDFGLSVALARYLDEFQKTSSMTIDRSIGDLGILDPEVELALFRVTQECMENVRKHSGVQHAYLTLTRAQAHVTLVIRDAGTGMAGSFTGGIGLAGMRERVESLGGELKFDVTEGVEVRAIVPAPMVAEHVAARKEV